MQTFLRALQGGLATCPVLQRSLDIIANGLKPDIHSNAAMGPVQANQSGTNSDISTLLNTASQLGHNGSLSTQNYGQSQMLSNQSATDLLPAFLFPQSPLTVPGYWAGGTDGPNAFNFLENFPEAQFADLPDDWFSSV